MAKIVFRIEITTLLGEDGQIEIRKLGRLAMLCTNLINAGHKLAIVTSGAIVLGSVRLGLQRPPESLNGKQAAAAVGQAELMRLYQNAFDEFKQMVAQVLITNDDFEKQLRRINAENTLENLMQRNIIPVINENDSVSLEDIVLGDNYPLASQVARLTDSELIIVKLGQDGKYMILDGFDGNHTENGEDGIFIAAEKCVERTKQGNLSKALFPDSIKELA
jgi:glutamate 5-kinase